MEDNSVICRLCGHVIAGKDQLADMLFSTDKRRAYYRCPVCALVFVPDAYVVTAEVEKREYDFHENSFSDPGYRKFLSRAIEPILRRFRVRIEKSEYRVISRPLEVLDFGCGPAPVLAEMLREALTGEIGGGVHVSVYDKYYACADPSVVEGEAKYDIITATEVVEHLHDAGAVLKRLWSLLRHEDGYGWLILMTKRVTSREKFDNWHYKRDPTHIAFFSEETFRWLVLSGFLGNMMPTLSIDGPDVVVFEKALNQRSELEGNMAPQ